MKNLAILLLLAIAIGGVASAQSISGRDHFTELLETTPGLVPSTAADVWTASVWVEEITLSNITASAATCTISDKQSTPRALFKDVSIAANSTVGARFTARYMPGGFTWSCSSATAIVGYARVRR